MIIFRHIIPIKNLIVPPRRFNFSMRIEDCRLLLDSVSSSNRDVARSLSALFRTALQSSTVCLRTSSPGLTRDLLPEGVMCCLLLHSGMFIPVILIQYPPRIVM
jgi:hypothetical protein